MRNDSFGAAVDSASPNKVDVDSPFRQALGNRKIATQPRIKLLNQDTKQEEETKVHVNLQEKKRKEFLYADPGVKIGEGKYGPVNLIIHRGNLCALKIIPKRSLDNNKRIQHILNEKSILHMLRKSQMSTEPIDFIVELIETFMDDQNVCFVFEYLPG